MSMKEHPILFSTRMAQAILEDRKRQTRRVVNSYNSRVGEAHTDWKLFDWHGEHHAPLPLVDGTATSQYIHVPYNWAEDRTVYHVYPRYQVGDHLWVRETTRMLRRDSRLTLVITGIRVQRVQDISDADVWAEGCINPGTRGQFAAEWESINGRKHPWRSNPYVWVIEFERLL